MSIFCDGFIHFWGRQLFFGLCNLSVCLVSVHNLFFVWEDEEAILLVYPYIISGSDADLFFFVSNHFKKFGRR